MGVDLEAEIENRDAEIERLETAIRRTLEVLDKSSLTPDERVYDAARFLVRVLAGNEQLTEK